MTFFFATGIKRRGRKADFAPTWKGRLKSIFVKKNKIAAQRRPPKPQPLRWVAVWKRGAAERARDELCNEMKKLVASAMTLATSWNIETL